LILATTLAAAQPACLPRSVFVNDGGSEFPFMELGYINNALTLCARKRALAANGDGLLGCWTVNSTTGVLGKSAATAIPGRGWPVDLDAQGCIHGYCSAPISHGDNGPFLATSTDGMHAAILAGSLLYIFETGTKAKVTEIELAKADEPDETNVKNAPFGLLYNGNTLFVIGTDAGPFIGVWVFKENGSRAGKVGTDANPLNIVNGGYGILSTDKVGFADAGLQNLTIVTGANAAKRSTKRTVSYAPCTKGQFEQWTQSDGEVESRTCKRVLDAKYRPYVDMSPVQLPSGDIVTTLSGRAQGDIAVLNPAGLTEKRRLRLARCP